MTRAIGGTGTGAIGRAHTRRLDQDPDRARVVAGGSPGTIRPITLPARPALTA